MSADSVIRERPITRALCLLVGIFFAVGIPLTPIIHRSARVTTMLGWTALLGFAAVGLLLGSQFVFVAVIGRAPGWFIRCAGAQRSIKQSNSSHS